MSDRRKKLFAAMAVLLGTALSLVFLEAVLRLFPPAWLEQRMRELDAGKPYEAGSDQAWPAVREDGTFRQFVAGSSFVVRHYEYEHTATLDELGGRVTPYRPGYDTLVPFLGDSFTFGVGVEDADTFVSLLAARGTHRLLNLGVPGSGLHDQLDILELRHQELGNPELYVFVLFTGNDLTDIRARHLRTDDPAGSGTPRPGWLWWVNYSVYHNAVLKKLYSIQFVRRGALVLMNRGEAGLMQPVFLAMRTDRSYLEDSLGHLRKELRRLEDLAGRLSFRYLFIMIPDVHQLDARRLAGKAESLGLAVEQLEPQRLTRAISKTLQDFRVPHVDVGPCLAESAIDDLYYIQDTHLTMAGHAAAAECISRSGILTPLFTTSKSTEPRPGASQRKNAT